MLALAMLLVWDDIPGAYSYRHNTARQRQALSVEGRSTAGVEDCQFCSASDDRCSPQASRNVQATAGVEDDDDYDDIAGRPGNTIGQPSIMNGLNRQMIHTNSAISNTPNVPVITLVGKTPKLLALAHTYSECALSLPLKVCDKSEGVRIGRGACPLCSVPLHVCLYAVV